MSEIKNGNLGLYGAECSKCNHMMTLGSKGIKIHKPTHYSDYSDSIPHQCVTIEILIIAIHKLSTWYWESTFFHKCHCVTLCYLHFITETGLRYVCVFAIANLSVVYNVHAPYYFRQYFFAIVYLSHPLTSMQNFTEIVSQGNPFIGGVKRKRGIATYVTFAYLCSSWASFIIMLL